MTDESSPNALDRKETKRLTPHRIAQPERSQLGEVMKSPAAIRSRLVLLAATALALTVVGLAPAAANAAPTTVSTVMSAKTPFCTAEAQRADLPPTDLKIQCFSARGAALAVATRDTTFAQLSDNEALALIAPGGEFSAQGSSASRAAAVPGTPFISIDSIDAYYRGGSIMWSVPGNGCDDSDWTANSMPDGYDNIVSSSFLTASGHCKHNYHFDLPNKAGSTVVDCNFGTSCDFMSTMNDATSSEWWFQDHPRP
jgi:hypothetical protein